MNLERGLKGERFKDKFLLLREGGQVGVNMPLDSAD